MDRRKLKSGVDTGLAHVSQTCMVVTIHGTPGSTEDFRIHGGLSTVRFLLYK